MNDQGKLIVLRNAVIIDGTGAALLYTYYENSRGKIKEVVLHVTGYKKDPSNFELSYHWDTLPNKWAPRDRPIRRPYQKYR